jgi:hypothetical protein
MEKELLLYILQHYIGKEPIKSERYKLWGLKLAIASDPNITDIVSLEQLKPAHYSTEERLIVIKILKI